MQCYRHSKEETNVSCGKCDRPICTKCMIPGPVGMRCPECASLRSSSLYKIHPGRLALAAVCAMPVGILGAQLLSFTGFFVLIVGPMYGAVVAEIILRISGRKRGPALEAIGVGSIILGALITALPWLLVTTGIATAAVPVGGMLPSLWQLLGCALGASTCYGRLKYL
jgi:hypothetical protein